MGNTGTILNTTNGGTNWSAQNGGVINSLNSVFFTDGNTGWAVGQLRYNYQDYQRRKQLVSSKCRI
ncbi:MAG: hypothetical protein R2942_05895 [Ignavibacteria bacterium]